MSSKSGISILHHDQSAFEDAADLRQQGGGSLTMLTAVERLVDYRATREVIMPASGSTTPSGRLLSAEALARFRPDSESDGRRHDHSQDRGQLLFTKGSSEISFAPFRLLPTQFLLLEGDNPV